MSRNFELLQRLENERTAGYSAAPALAAETPQLAPIAAAVPIPTEDPSALGFVERLGREEEIKLVHLLFLQPGNKRDRVIVFAGAEPGVGCSETCRRAAEVLATRVTGKVCLARTMSHLHSTGAAFPEGGSDSWRETDQRVTSNLWISDVCAPSSQASAQRLLSLRERFDYVLVDAAAVQPHGETAAAAQFADGVVLVVKAGGTRREAVTRALDALRAGNANIVGIVLNQRTFPVPQALYERL